MTAPVPTRLSSLDNLRGLIMAVMALDHVSLFVHHQHSSEFWTGGWTKYTDALAFLTRFVTHLCAPGFFFLMGVGMCLFASSRQERGWSAQKITLYFLKRGALLILLNVLLETWAWTLGTAFQFHHGEPGRSSPFLSQITLTVLSGLGMAMIGGSLLIYTGKFAALIGAGLLVLCNALVPNSAAAAQSYPLWMRLLFLPGNSSFFFVLYPMLPWLGICGLGIGCGRFLAAGGETARRALRAAPLVGVMFVATAVAIRYAGGFGNLRLPRDGSWMEFLNFIKYPPALTFALFMVGVNLILLSLLRGRVAVLNAFGQAPLCFYFAHLFLYASIGALFFRHPSALPTMYVVWLLGLVPLFFICRRFRRFKESKDADSLWRLF
jgi:uncharacterized membrane protein